MRALAALLALTCCLASTADAQPRQLAWPNVSVTAHLDADGILHVQERQVFRFSGDWNGGERRFAVSFGQRFEFDSIVRIDDSGVRHRLAEDDLDEVDEFAWGDHRTLRWRSRLPSDPPFDNTLLTYELAFRYANILAHDDGRTYVLDHDFGFADRPGAFEQFSVVLTLDPAWQPPANFTGRFEATNLPPGRGFVVHVPLVRVASTTPAAVITGAPSNVRLLLAAVLLAAVTVLFTRLLAHDRQLGRFAPAPPPHEVSRAFLEQEVYAHLPEVVGTAWDDDTSQAEVAATLARLVQEGKLASRVETKKILFFESHVLHLELEVPRKELQGHERTLIAALFDSNSTQTSTEEVRKRYSKTGFDPAKIISDALKLKADRLVPSREQKKVSKLPTLVLIGIAVVLLVLASIARGADGLVALAVVAISLPVYGIAFLAASVWRTRVHHLVTPAVFLFGSVAIMVILFSALVLGARVYPLSTLAVAGLSVWMLALVNSAFNRARLALSAERVALRKRLLAARSYFQDELAKPSPDFTDAAYPYLLAFGLGGHVDKWFRAFGGESSGAVMHAGGASTIGGSSSGGGNSSFGGFGGGGGFSGGGGGAAFGAAIGGMASSVPSPSSSSSGGGGGGGGGGGSSGGGGGGGW